jgi:hypothetical protein
MLPLWKGFDPLPVLGYKSKKEDKEKQKRDEREEDKQRREVGYMFDSNPKKAKPN